MFKSSIKPEGTGRIRKGKQCSVVLALRAPPLSPGRDTALPDLGSSACSADSSHTPEQRCGVRPADSFQTAQGGGKKKKCKSKCFVCPPDKSFCLFISFVQVALSRVMPLKCQLSERACIALDIKYSSPTHKKQQSVAALYGKKSNVELGTSLFPGGPCALIIRQSDRCFSNDKCLMCAELLPKAPP